MAKSNARALREYLESDPTLAEEWMLTECNHWAVGWVQHLTFRVLDDAGEPTRIFKLVTEWFNALSDYHIADESLYSEMETDACEDYWRAYQHKEVREQVIKLLQDRYMSDDSDEVIESAVDEIDDETWWTICVHNDGNGVEMENDSYRFSAREIERIADTVQARFLETDEPE